MTDKITSMEKKYFYLKLNPPRPSFVMDMTEEERNVMLQHIEYWKPYVDSGSMLVMGPVLDSRGPYGVGIIAIESEQELKKLIADDPANGPNSYECFPMKAMTKFN
jgi:uncharacterized protein